MGFMMHAFSVLYELEASWACLQSCYIGSSASSPLSHIFITLVVESTVCRVNMIWSTRAYSSSRDLKSNARSSNEVGDR